MANTLWHGFKSLCKIKLKSHRFKRDFLLLLLMLSKIEKYNNYSSVTAFGDTLKYFVENADDNLKKHWLQKLTLHCRNTKNFNTFLGYCTVFEAILEKTLKKLMKDSKSLLKVMKKNAKQKVRIDILRVPKLKIFASGVLA